MMSSTMRSNQALELLSSSHFGIWLGSIDDLARARVLRGFEVLFQIIEKMVYAIAVIIELLT